MASGEDQGCDGNDQAEGKWTTWIPEGWSAVTSKNQFENWPPPLTPLELRPHLTFPVGKQTGKRNKRPRCFFQLYKREKDGKFEYCAGPIYLLPKAKKRREDQQGIWKEGTGKPVKCKYCILYAENGTDPQKLHLPDEELCLLRANRCLGKASRTRNSTTERPNKKQKTQKNPNDQTLEASGNALPTSAPAVEQQVQPSNVVLASVSAPQQPLQPLNVESTVEQPQQQASGLDVLVQVMGESGEPSDTDSTTSEMTKWARKNNVDDFEKELPDFEPPTQPGIMPDPSADANFVNSFLV